MPAGKVKRRPGRPPGAKNKPKLALAVHDEPQRKPVVARPNGVRKQVTRVVEPRGFTKATSFLVVNPRHLKLMQKWSGETKIGVQQIFDDIFLAGSSAVYKSFYRGLINSRRAAEAQFDAETNIEGLAEKANQGTERINRLPDISGIGRAPGEDLSTRSREQPNVAPLGPGQLEEVGADLEDSFGIADAAPVEIPLPDAPPSAPPEEEEPEPPEETGEPPY